MPSKDTFVLHVVKNNLVVTLVHKDYVALIMKMYIKWPASMKRKNNCYGFATLIFYMVRNKKI